MAVAPRAKRSAKQVAASKAWAAAGRAAQRGRPRTQAQHLAALKWAAAGRAAQAAGKSAKKAAAKPKTRAAVAPAGLAPARDWLLGGNDVLPTCAAAAIANHLLAATGIAMTDEEILHLHLLAGGDNGATIASALEAYGEYWGRLCRGKARLRTFTRTDENIIVAGLVVGITLPHAGHAVLSCPGGMISWGHVLPWAGEPEEAWALEWET